MSSNLRVDAPAALRAPGGNRLARRIGWGVVTLLSLGVAGYAIALIATNFAILPPSVAANAFPSGLGIRTHIVGSALALLIGPFQFLRALRNRYPRVHRWLGRVYLTACLVGGLAGGSIALFSTGGLVAGFGFLGLAIAWLFCTIRAYVAVRAHDYRTHQRWMLRSFALTFAAVMLRIYTPLSQIVGFDFDIAYAVIAWLCWVPNLLVVQRLVSTARGV